MPLSDFQILIFSLLKKNRNPDSYVAGGTAINYRESSLRFSNDIDFFHDLDEKLASSSAKDIQVLKQNGFEVKFIIERPGFIRAVVSKNQESLKLEWVRDTAFRFFPVIEDPQMGYRLHDFDLATNKCLALADRSVIRDVIDLIHIHQHSFSLFSACWGACGKDLGYTPDLMLNFLRRNSIISPETLAAETLIQKINPQELKMMWLEILDQTSKLTELFPAEDLGCVYLDDSGQAVECPDPSQLASYKKHFGSAGGSWPKVV